MAKQTATPAIVIPTVIRVDGKNYKVLSKRLKGGILGLMDGAKQEITISPAHHTPDEIADTILHEVLHCIEYNNGMEVDEPRVRRTATALIAILRDNPELAQIIIGNYKWKTPK